MRVVTYQVDPVLRQCEPQDDESRLRRACCWERCKLFLICATASAIATAAGVMTAAFIYMDRYPPSGNNGNTLDNQTSLLESYFPLWELKLEIYEGGSISCARYRENVTLYTSLKEQIFGTSIHSHQSGMSICILYLLPGGLRIPNWNLQGHIHGFVYQGTVWVGIIDNNSQPAVTFNVTCGQVFFVPRNSLHWIKNIGGTNATVLLYIATHDDFSTIELDQLITVTDEDILTRSLRPLTGVDFIRLLQNYNTSQVINLYPVIGPYPQSPVPLLWNYFLDMEGERKSAFGDIITTWAGYYTNTTGLSQHTIVYGNSLLLNPGALGLGVVTLKLLALLGPYYNVDVHEMAYVLKGCGTVGIINPQFKEFNIVAGDVIYFPPAVAHYIKNTCEEDLILVRAFNRPFPVENFFLDYFFQTIPLNILAQTFQRPESVFTQIPAIRNNMTYVYSYGNICIIQSGMTTTTTTSVTTATTTRSNGQPSRKQITTMPATTTSTTVKSTPKNTPTHVTREGAATTPPTTTTRVITTSSSSTQK